MTMLPASMQTQRFIQPSAIAAIAMVSPMEEPINAPFQEFSRSAKFVENVRKTFFLSDIKNLERNFYKNQMEVKIEHEIIDRFQLLDHLKQFNKMPAHYYFNKYGVIELDSDGFRFNHAIIKRMKAKGIIDDDFICDDDFMINPYFEFRYLGNIFDFQQTKMQCGIFKVNK
jgi:hypothetical protein